MKREIGLLIAVGATLVGCDVGVPNVRDAAEPIVPGFTPPRTVALEQAPSSRDPKSLAAAGDDSSSAQGCVNWVTEREEWNSATGEFDYLYTCAEGGDIAAIHRFGKDDLLGNGTYQDVYAQRDGDTVVWSYTYALTPDGLGQTYEGSSNAGESYTAKYVYGANGETQVHEVWTMAEGTYVVDGTYDANFAFNGTYSFDDPTTPESPDWTVVDSAAADGTITQKFSGSAEGWATEYTYVVYTDDHATYDFTYDDAATSVNPDYEGSYLYGADGQASGSYVQHFGDGSRLSVHQGFNVSETGYAESWSFDDATTDQPVDQEGSMAYDALGNGTGTLITHIVDGAVETCDLKVSPDGATVIDNCR